MGRFINADAFATTGQGLLGNNMFAYCNNNPVNTLDTSGTYPQHLLEDLHVRDSNPIAEYYGASNGNNSNKTAKPSAIAKLKRTATSIMNNFEFSVGVGQGLYAEFNILEFGAALGMYGNYAALNYSDGQWMFGQEICETASLSASQAFEVGFGINRFLEKGKVVESSSWYIINDTQESWTVFRAACYPLFLGGSIRIGFELNTFLNDMKTIW